MKNIEKYPDTNDTLDAFRAYMEKKYETPPPPPPTLLEAAEAVKNEWYTTFPNVMLDTLCEKIVDLENAIAREKSKPVRNCDRYRTAEDADAGFVAMCEGIDKCEHCRLYKNHVRCSIAFLFAEADKEKTK